MTFHFDVYLRWKVRKNQLPFHCLHLHFNFRSTLPFFIVLRMDGRTILYKLMVKSLVSLHYMAHSQYADNLSTYPRSLSDLWNLIASCLICLLLLPKHLVVQMPFLIAYSFIRWWYFCVNSPRAIWGTTKNKCVWFKRGICACHIHKFYRSFTRYSLDVLLISLQSLDEWCYTRLSQRSTHANTHMCLHVTSYDSLSNVFMVINYFVTTFCIYAQKYR